MKRVESKGKSQISFVDSDNLEEVTEHSCIMHEIMNEVGGGSYESKWNPILIHMKIFGLNLHQQGYNVYSIIIMICVSFFVIPDLYFFVNSLIVLDFVSALIELVFLIDSVTIIVCLFHFHRNKKDIVHQVKEIFQMSLREEENCNREKKMLLLKIIFVWLFAIAFCVSACVKNVRYINEDTYKGNNTLHQIFSNRIFITISDAFYAFVIGIGICTLLIFFNTICKEIVRKWNDLIKVTEDSKDFSDENLSFIIKNYFKLYDIVYSISNIYSFILLLWTIGTVSKAIFAARQLIYLKYTDFILILVFFVRITYPLYLFFEMCFYSSDIIESSRKLSKIVYKKSVDCKDSLCQESSFKFSVKSAQDFPCFNAYKMLTLDRSLILAIASAALVYLIVFHK